MNDLVEKCKRLATQAHEGQIRKFGDDKGKPYIIHPERIASKMDNHVSECVAWLHDTIEDTDIEEWDLVGLGIPFEIINAVKALTKQEGENYCDFILRVKEDVIAREVKIADIEDNMVSLKEGSLKDKYRLARYILKGFNK